MDNEMQRIAIRPLTHVEKDAFIMLMERRSAANAAYDVAHSAQEAARSELHSIGVAMAGMTAMVHGEYDENLGVDLDSFVVYADIPTPTPDIAPIDADEIQRMIDEGEVEVVEFDEQEAEVIEAEDEDV